MFKQNGDAYDEDCLCHEAEWLLPNLGKGRLLPTRARKAGPRTLPYRARQVKLFLHSDFRGLNWQN
jgi:hypothetical protein